MSDHLTIQGTLAETTVPDLFRSMIRSGETGIVTLEAIGRHDTVFFEEGKIISATSSDSDLGLAEVLFRRGEIDLHQLSTAQDRLVGSQRIAMVLCDLGYLRLEELVLVETRQVQEIVINALAYRSGSYTVDFTAEFPQEIVRLSIDTERLVLDAVGQISYWSLVSRGVGRMNRLVRHTSGSESRIFHLELSEEESHVFSLLAEPQTVENVCERSYLSDFTTCRTLWALLAANLLEEGDSAEVDERRAVAESELELEASVEKYNAAFQNLFSIVFQEIGDETYDFVNEVAKHLRPETLPYLSGISLENEGRIDFDQLLNNVIASGASDHSPVVSEILDQLLYGWVVEIGGRFGDRLDGDVRSIVDPLRG